MFESVAGRICIGSAAVITLLQFVLLALAEAAVADPAPGKLIASTAASVGGTAGLAVGLGVAGRLWEAWRRRHPSGELGPTTCILVYVVVLLAADATDRLGFTVVLGGFIAGCAMPFDSKLRAALKAPFKTLNSWLLLPIFFVVSGLATNLRLLQPDMLPGVLIIILAALASKLLVALAAPLTGLAHTYTVVLYTYTFTVSTLILAGQAFTPPHPTTLHPAPCPATSHPPAHPNHTQPHPNPTHPHPTPLHPSPPHPNPEGWDGATLPQPSGVGWCEAARCVG